VKHTLLFLSGLAACSSSGGTSDIVNGNTDCTQASYFPDLVAAPENSEWEDPAVGVDCQEDTFVVRSNGIPNYEYVAATPNPLSEQDWEWTIALNPEQTGTQEDIPLLGTAGFTVNGIPIYGPNEADFPDPYGDPVYNNVVDFCLGHTGGTDDYHYHALLVECILGVTDVATTEASPVLGFSLDGFPIYGPLGCTDEACEELVEFKSSWETTGDPTEYAWDANECTKDTCDEASGEYLDRCNGRVGPDGTYRYHATATFPYILGCFSGTPSDDAGEGSPVGNPAGQ